MYKADSILLGKIAVQDHFPFEKNQFYIIHLKKQLQTGKYVVKLAFESELRAELGGFYRMNYRRKDGTVV